MSSFFECFNNFVQSGGVRPAGAAQEEDMQMPPTPTPSETSSTISVPSESSAPIGDKMEHSYMREAVRSDLSNGLAPTRTILVRHPPQCPSCHTYPPQEQQEPSELQQAHVPPYDEITAKELMNECARIAKYVKNSNYDEQDWEARVNQFGWTYAQKALFDRVARILDLDQLARLANDKRQHEAIHRRVTVDKSSSRMRRALASVAWEPRTTQWLHLLLMEHLPPSYMASYLDIMQTLKTKLPTLTDKMLFSRPLNNSQELLAPVMKKQWEPIILPKSRQLAHNAIMVALPTMPTSGQVPERMEKWYKSLATITQVVQITLPNTNDRIAGQNLDQVAETIVSLTRVRIHELRTENPNRGIILVGFNAGAALALQVAMSESVACVICLGFAYNTLRGPRGSPDDRLLDIKAPILFVVGQNSARTSQEEMEALRERMQSESSLVVVGSADDALRVPKSKRRIEGVTQSMVDAMVVDELYEFISKTLSNPPGPRMPTALLTSNAYYKQKHLMADGNANKAAAMARKRKGDTAGGTAAGTGVAEEGGTPAKTKYVPHKVRVPKVPKPKPPRLVDPFAAKRKVGRPRTRPLPNVKPAPTPVSVGVKSTSSSSNFAPTNEELNLSIESILDDSLDYDEATQPSSSPAIAAKSVGVPIAVAAAAAATPALANSAAKTTVSLSAGTKIKMIPASSQFVQLKTLPTSQNKMINYTINKPSSSIGSIMKTLPTNSSGQQIFTLKTPTGHTTQFVTAASPAAQQKYTVIKNPNGTTTVQLTKNMPAPVTSAASGSMDLSNIIDMPIVFADSEGNIAEQQQQQMAVSESLKTAPTAPLIISQKIIKEANPAASIAAGLPRSTNIVATGAGKSNTIVLNKGLQQLFTTQTGVGGNKVVYLNRSAMKPMTNVLTTRLSGSGVGGAAQPQYTKIVVTNPKGASTSAAANQLLVNAAGSSGVKTLNLQTLKSPTTTTLAPGTLRHTGSVSVGNKTYPQFQVINSAGGIATAVSPGSVSVVGDGKQPQIRNIILKTGSGLKQLPLQMLANRPATVASVAPSTSGGGAAVRRVFSIGAVSKVASPVQEGGQPKIIKLPTTTTLTKSPSKGGE